MSLLAPIAGLLALSSIIALIIIYLIKPNFQQKIISSTFIWKLSLKLKKKKLPINRLRNILLFICQVLILGVCSAILAQPVIKAEVPEEFPEKIMIIDASGDMKTTENAVTRFDRALAEIQEEAEDVLSKNGFVTVIYAGETPSFVVQRVSGKDSIASVASALKKLQCTYGDADLQSAVSLTEQVLWENPKAEVLLYTANSYLNDGGVKVVDVSASGEWNAAILNCSAVLEDNYYTFYIDVAAYGMEKDLQVCVDVWGGNDGTLKTVSYQKFSRCGDDKGVQQIIINTRDDKSLLYSYDYVHVYLVTDDSFLEDNEFYLYGGTRPTLRVQYYSSRPNTFFNGAMMELRDSLRPFWNIQYTRVEEGGEYEVEGYDLYIFEHNMPAALPTDGVVILSDMDKEPKGADISLAETETDLFYLANGAEHPITAYINAEEIFLSSYTRISSYDNYEELMYCGGDPVLLVRNTPESKVVAMPFSLNLSNFAGTPYFHLMMFNIFNYFFPTTSDAPVYNVGDTVTLNARAETLTVVGPDVNEAFETFPSTLNPLTPGTFTATQALLSGELCVENFFVKIPASESNIYQTFDSLECPFPEQEIEIEDQNLLFYFAIALVALLFAEWWLQSREQF